MAEAADQTPSHTGLLLPVRSSPTCAQSCRTARSSSPARRQPAAHLRPMQVRRRLGHPVGGSGRCCWLNRAVLGGVGRWWRRWSSHFFPLGQRHIVVAVAHLVVTQPCATALLCVVCGCRGSGVWTLFGCRLCGQRPPFGCCARQRPGRAVQGPISIAGVRQVCGLFHARSTSVQRRWRPLRRVRIAARASDHFSGSSN